MDIFSPLRISIKRTYCKRIFITWGYKNWDVRNSVELVLQEIDAFEVYFGEVKEIAAKN